VIHQNAAAYVLDALDSEEERDFERHLGVCPECEAELEPLRVAATALAFAGELPRPRATLRKRVLAVDAVVQLRRRWTTPLAAVAALAACAALVVGLQGGTSVPGIHALQLQRQTPGLSLSGRLLVTDDREAVLVTSGLGPPAAGSVYEIWVVGDGPAVPAGFLRGGIASLTRRVPTGAAVAVSIEPRGGSRRPTGPLLLTTETA
jgi:anti-sigma-K factor RskA